MASRPTSLNEKAQPLQTGWRGGMLMLQHNEWSVPTANGGAASWTAHEGATPLKEAATLAEQDYTFQPGEALTVPRARRLEVRCSKEGGRR
jgi:hypothetical protein